MIRPISKSHARLGGIFFIAAFLCVAAWPVVAAVSLGPVTTNAAQEKMERELKFYDAKISLQQQIAAGKVRYELRQAKRAEAIKAMAAQLAGRRQEVTVGSVATFNNNQKTAGRFSWTLLIFAAFVAGLFGVRYYRNHRPGQNQTP